MKSMGNGKMSIGDIGGIKVVETVYDGTPVTERTDVVSHGLPGTHPDTPGVIPPPPPEYDDGDLTSAEWEEMDEEFETWTRETEARERHVSDTIDLIVGRMGALADQITGQQEAISILVDQTAMFGKKSGTIADVQAELAKRDRTIAILTQEISTSLRVAKERDAEVVSLKKEVSALSLAARERSAEQLTTDKIGQSANIALGYIVDNTLLVMANDVAVYSPALEILNDWYLKAHPSATPLHIIGQDRSADKKQVA